MITKKHKLSRKAKKHSSKQHKLCGEVEYLLRQHTNPHIISQFTQYTDSKAHALYTHQQSTINRIFNIHNQLLTQLSNGQIKIQITNQSLASNLQIPRLATILSYLQNNRNDIPSYYLKGINLEKLNSPVIRNPHNYLQNHPYIGTKILSAISYLVNNPKHSSQIPCLEFHNLLYNKFTSFLILKHLEKHIRKCYSISINYKGKQYDNLIYLFGYNNLDKTHYGKLNFHQYIHEMISRILFFNEYLDTSKMPDKLIFFITDLTKEINPQLEQDAHFRALHVNSAVTNGIEIIIYRKEELLKSIFHELIHFHNLDYRNITTDQYNRLREFIITTHDISQNNKYLFYECITESLANMLNNIYSINPHITSSNDITGNDISGNTMLTTFTRNYSSELLFSTFQIAKILNIARFKSWGDFIGGDPWTVKKGRKFQQDSCVFSYYVLKMYILLNMEMYFAGNLNSKLAFIAGNESIDNLLTVFNTSRNDQYLAGMINIILDFLSQGSKGKMSNSKGVSIKNIENIENNITRFRKSVTRRNLSPRLIKTLRMTCLETS